MIQDIFPYKYNPEYIHKKISDKDFLLIFSNEKVLLQLDIDSPFISYDKIKPLLSSNSEPVYLFSIDDKNFFLALEHNIENSDFLYKPISIFRDLTVKWHAFACITAYHLSTWYSQNIFCGKCGKLNSHSETERALSCSCGSTRYPTISPAVIVAVTHGNRLLLTKYANRNYSNFALIAGFGEIGETLEETVKREVFEEVGLKIGNIKYYKSQPWGLSGSLLVGYFAELEGTPSITLDEKELSQAIWFEKEEIPQGVLGISLTQEMIEFFRNN